jgi:hypothetical protein
VPGAIKRPKLWNSKMVKYLTEEQSMALSVGTTERREKIVKTFLKATS